MHNFKGISPLVAAVLLIAVTMTIAGVLAYWASTFVRTQTQLFQNESITTECNFARFLVYSCSYSSNTSKINLILNNVGSVDLSDLVAQVIYPNTSIVNIKLNATLAANLLQPYTISGVSSDYSTINIKTRCPNVEAVTACK